MQIIFIKLYKNKYNQECYCFYMQCHTESSKWPLASQDIFYYFSAIIVLYAKQFRQDNLSQSRYSISKG